MSRETDGASVRWQKLRSIQVRLGWSDRKLSGHIRKHYLRVRTDSYRHPIGEFMSLPIDDMDRLLQDMERAAND